MAQEVLSKTNPSAKRLKKMWRSSNYNWGVEVPRKKDGARYYKELRTLQKKSRLIFTVFERIATILSLLAPMVRKIAHKTRKVDGIKENPRDKYMYDGSSSSSSSAFWVDVEAQHGRYPMSELDSIRLVGYTGLSRHSIGMDMNTIDMNMNDRDDPMLHWPEFGVATSNNMNERDDPMLHWPEFGECWPSRTQATNERDDLLIQATSNTNLRIQPISNNTAESRPGQTLAMDNGVGGNQGAEPVMLPADNNPLIPPIAIAICQTATAGIFTLLGQVTNMPRYCRKIVVVLPTIALVVMGIGVFYDKLPAKVAKRAIYSGFACPGVAFFILVFYI